MSKVKKHPIVIDDKSKYIISDTDLNDEYMHMDQGFLVPVLGLHEFDGHFYISGATGCGKSYLIRKMVDNDFKKRDCILFTDLVKEDPAFKGMKYKKYDEKGEYNSDWLSKNQDGKIMIFDDVQFNKDILNYRDKVLEKGRHHNIIAICVNHKLRDYFKTKVMLNDCKFIIVFPICNKGAISKYLRDEFDMHKDKIEQVLNQSIKEGRHLVLHKHSPNLAITTESIFKM